MAFLLKSYLRILERRPLVTQAATTGLMMCTGDAIAQFAVEKRALQQYDKERGLRFLLFGTFIAGPSLRGWYVLLDRICKGPPLVTTFKKIALDQSIMSPSFLVVFLGVMETVKSRSFENTPATINKNFVPILLTGYKIWPTAQLINFYFVPLQHRVLFVQVVALFWNTFLSFKFEKKDDDQVPAS